MISQENDDMTKPSNSGCLYWMDLEGTSMYTVNCG